MPVEWHPHARADVLEIADYISIDDPGAAIAVLDEIGRQIGMLAAQPRMGRRGRVHGTRELVIVRTPFIAAYRVDGDVVTVLRVLHGARRWPRRL